MVKTDATGQNYTRQEQERLANLSIMQGRKADTLQAANALIAGVGPMGQTMPEMADAFLAIPALAYTRFGEWDRILKLPEPVAAMPASRATWHYARTVALLARCPPGYTAMH